MMHTHKHEHEHRHLGHMISVEEALEKILSYVNEMEPEEKPILDAMGQVLAQDVYAPFSVPPYDNAAMDGFAVQWESIRGASSASPAVLRVIEEVPAGYIAKNPVSPGTAIRIMTGAPMPVDADTVVPFEDTDEATRKAARPQRNLDQIAVLEAVKSGDNIRYAGEDIEMGQLVLEKGRELRPADIGVLASLGFAVIPVIRRPVIAILATGDELINPSKPLTPGKIYDSNSYSMAAQVRRYGGIPLLLGIAQDNLEDLTRKIQQGMNADMVITSAGVSRGDYDIVKDVLVAQGEIAFWTVRMKPGKPLAFGVLVRKEKGGEKRVPHLGMPGNPVSSMVTFELFGRAALRKMMGKRPLSKPTVQAILEDRIVNTDGRRVFARAWVTRREGQYYAHLTGDQGSGILTSMSLANCLAIVPEDRKKVSPGEIVKVMMLDWDEE